MKEQTANQKEISLGGYPLSTRQYTHSTGWVNEKRPFSPALRENHCRNSILVEQREKGIFFPSPMCICITKRRKQSRRCPGGSEHRLQNLEIGTRRGDGGGGIQKYAHATSIPSSTSWCEKEKMHPSIPASSTAYFPAKEVLMK